MYHRSSVGSSTAAALPQTHALRRGSWLLALRIPHSFVNTKTTNISTHQIYYQISVILRIPSDLNITQAASVAEASELSLLAAGSHTPDLKVSQMPSFSTCTPIQRPSSPTAVACSFLSLRQSEESKIKQRLLSIEWSPIQDVCAINASVFGQLTRNNLQSSCERVHYQLLLALDGPIR